MGIEVRGLLSVVSPDVLLRVGLDLWEEAEELNVGSNRAGP